MTTSGHAPSRTRAVVTACLTLAGAGAVTLTPLASPAEAATSTVVSLTFNDGHSSQYSYARPLLQSHSMNATFYVASGWVDAASNSSMSWAQLRNLYRDGDEVGGMGKDRKDLTATYNSDPAQDLAYKQAQVCDDRQRLITMGVDPQTFAYPAAAVNAAAKSIVKGCGYLAGRTIGGLPSTASPYAEPIPPVDPYAVRTANIPVGAVSLSTLQNAVNAAAGRGGGWLPISFTQVCHQGTSNYNTCMGSSKPIDDVVLGQFLDWLKSTGQTGGAPAGTTVRTVRDVMGAPVPPPLPVDPTAVSLTFNDGLVSGYTNAGPVLKAHNMHGTFYVVSSWVDNKANGYLASWQLDQLYRDGNEIGGEGKEHKDLTQTYNSDPAQDYAYKKAQVCDDRQRLAQLGYDPQSFAYPFGAYNASAEAIVKDCGYLSGRLGGGLASGTNPAAETLPPKDAYAVRTPVLPTGPVSLDTLKADVNNAANAGGGWLPFAFNQVCHQADANYSTCMGSSKPIDDAVLSAFLDWLQNGAPAGVSVKTVRDVMGAPTQPPLTARTTDVSLTFDDGITSQYGLLNMLASHNAHATFYIPSADIDRHDSGALTWAQVNDLAAAGNDIGGHTLDHVNLKGDTYASVYHQVCDDRARLFQLGFNPVSFAYPFAAFDAQSENIVQACGYQSGRTGGSVSSSGPTYAETLPPKDAYATRALGTTYNGPITLQSLQDSVNAASLHGGGWLQLVFHVICYQGDANYATCMNGYRPVDDTTMRSFLDWMQTGAPAGSTLKDVAEVMGGGSTVPVVSVASPTSGQTVGSSTPTITGTAASTGGNVTVSLYSGTYATGAPTANFTASNDSGSWSVTPTNALADGTYTVAARQTRSGLTGYSTPTTFTVSSSVPAVTLSSPTDGSTVKSATPKFSGAAGTASGDAQTVSLAIYSGTGTTGTAAQTVTAPVSGGSWSVSAATLAPGQYTASASQSNTNGNTGTSAPVTFTVDTTGPVVTITAPADGSQLNTATPRLAGTASAASDASSVRVSVYAGSTATGTPVQSSTATVASDGSWSSNTSALTEGTYTVQAAQTDGSGNVGTSRAVTFTVKTSAPTVTLTSPSDGAVVGTATPTIAGAAGTAAGDSNQVTVRLYAGTGVTASPVQTAVADVASGAWSVVAASLADGTYTAQVTQTDTSGNTGTSAPVTFTIDTTAPAVTITAPTDGATITSADLTVSGTAGVGNRDAATVNMQIYNGSSASGTALKTVSSPVTAGAWTTDASGLANGTYTLRATQTDSAGNSGSSLPVTVTLASAFQVTGVSPAAVGQGALAKTLTISGSGFTSGVTVSFSGAGITPTATTVSSSTSLLVTVNVGASAATGTRDIVVGQPGQRAATCSGCLTVNAKPSVSVLSPNTLGQGATQAAVKVNGSAFVTGAMVTFSGAGVTDAVTSTSSSQILLSVSVASGAATGARDVTVVQPDGGRTTCVGCLTVTAGPAVTSVSPASITRGTSVTVTISGTMMLKGANVTVSGTGLAVTKTTWVSRTSMTAVFTATANAATGLRSVTVTNPDLGSSTCANCLTVK